MNLQAQLTTVLNEISEIGVTNLAYLDIISMLDLTLLDETATAKQIDALAIKAHQHKVAAICVLPQHLANIPTACAVKRATVINFPTGDQPPKDVLNALQRILASHAPDEIDYVFPYNAFLAGQEKHALSCCEQIFSLCKQTNTTFKVILETGAFPTLDLIYKASAALVDVGCDFLKTSTGKITQGASIPAAFTMLSAIKASNSSCGIKLSGGIKTPAQALAYLTLAEHLLGRKAGPDWFRIGASSLLDELLNTALTPTT